LVAGFLTWSFTEAAFAPSAATALEILVTLSLIDQD
jgi:hypothetical protein